MDPKKSIKGQCLNNLAVAYWWHKLPNHEYMGTEENSTTNDDYSREDLEKEFNTVVSMCKRSIEVTEVSLPEFAIQDPEFKKRFVELIDGTNIVPDNIEEWVKLGSDSMINNPESIKALLNIAEFVLVTGGDTSMATLWLKYGLKIAEKLDNVPKARVLMFIARICAEKEQYIKAEGLFKTCEELLKHEICFERVHLYQIFAAMLEQQGNRKTECDSKLNMAGKISKFLPYWSPRMMNVSIPEFK